MSQRLGVGRLLLLLLMMMTMLLTAAATVEGSWNLMMNESETRRILGRSDLYLTRYLTPVYTPPRRQTLPLFSSSLQTLVYSKMSSTNSSIIG